VDEVRRLGSYRLKKKIGTGGMGEVYLGEHEFLKQPCAIKVIRPDRVTDPRTIQRFEREVQATARLQHPNSIEIYDYGRAEDGTFYYVMEYLPGKTLEQLVDEGGRIPVARAVHFLLQLCGPLREAHGIGLIHRDIKPANVIICRRGGVADWCKLLDFGLVKDISLGSQNVTLTHAGAIAGTPAYMSPEQVANVRDLDGRSDIYGLGALAYFMLTGRPPFEGLPLKVLADQLHTEHLPIHHLNKSVPMHLSQLIDRCLSKNRDERYDSVVDLYHDLQSIACAFPWTERDAESCWSERIDELSQSHG
ncbi:MAG: serine/threonine-protein kinase, partial [Pirellula sp.]